MAGFGWPRCHYRLTDSTNARARLLAQAGTPSGTVVTASEQTAGRGRMGRTWSAPAGKALLCSYVLRPLGRAHRLLPLSVPLAVCAAVEDLGAGPARVKWPNDVWLDEAKLAGVLIEARPPEWAVIGVGLNVAVDPAELPADLRWPAASLGGAVTPEEALGALSRALGRWYEASDEEVLYEFARRDSLAGRPVAWEGGGDRPSGSGIAEGVDADGNLIVQAAGRRLALGAGEVRLRPARE
jgi:BirA family transcriptional regulator, biotin operon repressor / biotin---[acetyl-CoA-carboxylase] ligase